MRSMTRTAPKRLPIDAGERRRARALAWLFTRVMAVRLSQAMAGGAS